MKNNRLSLIEAFKKAMNPDPKRRMIYHLLSEPNVWRDLFTQKPVNKELLPLDTITMTFGDQLDATAIRSLYTGEELK